MDVDQTRRSELADFLRARRAQLSRTDLGLPPVARRRTTGLRREEVSLLSGVSVTWYTWLEQGRDIRPSRQVLDAIAGTLRLSRAEHTYVLSLAGYSALPPGPSPTVEPAPAHVQRLLDAMAGYPAFAIAPDWAITGWNAAYAALYPNIATVPIADRNLLWLVFTDPSVRTLLPDWEDTSHRFLAEFRAEAGPRLGNPTFAALVERLLDASEAFRDGWERHDIQGFSSRERLFHHALVGDLRLEHHRLAPSDHPDLHIVIYTPVDDTTHARLRTLVGGDGASRDPATAEPRSPSTGTPVTGMVHHVELWVPDLDRAIESWGWLLHTLGYTEFQHWPAGRSWRLGTSYIVVEQSPDLSASEHDRRRPGLNHLALHVEDSRMVNALAAQAPRHGWSLLFPDSHPYAGGRDHYAAYLENADGFEVELVAARRHQ